ncbi:MAG: 50S ribosomal protein L29 [Ignavibacteriales bacterium]|nr:50S ribosomal protein L29 [Ignavibacteriales bacterium]
MKAFELRQLSDEELRKRIDDEQENLANLKFQKVLSQPENPMKVRQTRREIARMKTVLRERELKGSQPVSGPPVNEKVSSKQ